MPTKREQKDLKALLDHMEEIDPMGAVVVTAAGIAGLCGVSGPLTTIIDGFIGSNGKGVQFAGPTSTAGQAINVLEWWNYFLQPSGNSPVPANDSERQAMIIAIGSAAGNMVEAGIMYSLVKNPETLKTLMDMGKSAANGAIGLGKAGAAILGG
jgi:hypothetical protein